MGVTEPHIAKAIKRYAQQDERDPRTIHQVLSPSEAGEFLAKRHRGCLTHIVRIVVHGTASYREKLSVTYEAECGTWVYGWNSDVIDPADATFGCHRCIAVALAHDRPTFNLIPDTGCSATGGERYRPRKADDGYQHPQADEQAAQ